MPTDNGASNQATKVESVSTDTKRIQTEDPHIVGTYGTPGWSRPIYIEKDLYKKVPKQGAEGPPSPSPKLEEERKAP